MLQNERTSFNPVSRVFTPPTIYFNTKYRKEQRLDNVQKQPNSRVVLKPNSTDDFTVITDGLPNDVFQITHMVDPRQSETNFVDTTTEINRTTRLVRKT